MEGKFWEQDFADGAHCSGDFGCGGFTTDVLMADPEPILFDGLGDDDPDSSSSFSTPQCLDKDYSPPDRRPLNGHYKQAFTEDPRSSGFTPSRSEIHHRRYRKSSKSDRNDVKRVSRGWFKHSPWNSGDLRQQNHNFATISAQRSVADPQTYASPSPCQLKLLSLKGQQDKNDDGVNVAANTSLGDDRENDHLVGSITWKELSRSESDGSVLESSFLPSKESPFQSMLTSSLLYEGDIARKKQRLGWGQGLAKYEKEVEGPEDSSFKEEEGIVLLHAGSGATLSEKTAPVVSASPTTRTSFTCSSSKVALEEKLELSTVNNDIASHMSDSHGLELQKSPVEFSKQLEHLNVYSISSLSSLLAELLQHEDICSGDFDFTRNNIVLKNKLLLLKIDILKELEKTDGEIDSYESKLKDVDIELEKTHQISHLQSDTFSRKCCSIFPCFPLGDSISTADVSHNKFVSGGKVSQSDTAAVVMSNTYSLGLARQGSTDFSIIRSDKYPVTVESTKSEILQTQSVLLNDCSESDKSLSVRIVGDDKNVICANSENFLHDEVHCSLVSQIMASNRESARKASEVLGNHWSFRSPLLDGRNSNKLTDSKIREKMAIRKSVLKFKETALAHMFCVFHRLWKEDLHSLSMINWQLKSHKQCELGCSKSRNGSQKHISSLHTNLFSSDNLNLTLLPTKKPVDFTSQLLSDSKIKIHRSYLKMPSLILDERERRHSRFITKNGLIGDPFFTVKENELINPWTTEEKTIFLDRLGTYGKNFRKISSFLEHKTTADCVEFYYKRHKSESFEAVKNMLKLRKKGQKIPSNNYLLSSRKNCTQESVVAPLDILGEILEMVVHSNDNKIQQKSAGYSASLGSQDMNISHWTYAGPSRAEILGEATDLRERMEFLQVSHPFFSKVGQIIDEEDSCSDEGFSETELVTWSDDDRCMFINALRVYGRDFTRISHFLGTRTKEECKRFYSKTRRHLALDMVYEEVSSSDGLMTYSDANQGKHDTDNACVADMELAICSNQSCSEGNDFTQSVMLKTSNQDFPQAVIFCHQTDCCSKGFEAGWSKHE